VHELAPATLVDLDAVAPRRLSDAPPGVVAISVRDPLDLVEARHGVADVPRVDQGLLALLREREPAVGEPVLLRRTQPRRPAGRAARGAGAPGLRGRAAFPFSALPLHPSDHLLASPQNCKRE